MTVEHFQKILDYHITLNHKLWDRCVMQLTDAQFTQEIPYSIGSIHAQTVHMMSIDERWFSGIRNEPLPDFLKAADFPDRAAVRAYWDTVEATMRDTLSTLTPERLEENLSPEFKIWEVLWHVFNHGTDHRAQVLAGLNHLGIKTFPQDYFFYAHKIDV